MGCLWLFCCVCVCLFLLLLLCFLNQHKGEQRSKKRPYHFIIKRGWSPKRKTKCQYVTEDTGLSKTHHQNAVKIMISHSRKKKVATSRYSKVIFILIKYILGYRILTDIIFLITMILFFKISLLQPKLWILQLNNISFKIDHFLGTQNWLFALVKNMFYIFVNLHSKNGRLTFFWDIHLNRYWNNGLKYEKNTKS